jgi:large conductance mechanosensitive channel
MFAHRPATLTARGHTPAPVRETRHGQRIDLGAFISAIIYFIIFMAVIYFLIVVPYRAYMKKRGTTVFGEAVPTKTCPSCRADDLPADAIKCRYCTTVIQVA